MPAKSKKQLKWLYGVAAGTIKAKGMTPDQAQEWIDSTPDKSELPKKSKKKKK